METAAGSPLPRVFRSLPGAVFPLYHVLADAGDFAGAGVLPWTSGNDLVIEGIARRVTDDATLQRLAKRYGDQGWPARVVDGAFTYDYSAPSAGPPPWDVYSMKPTTIYGVLGSEPGGATCWRFDD